MTASDRALTDTIALTQPIDLLGSLRPLVFSAADPTIRLRPRGFARASHTPEGPGTVIVERAARDPLSYGVTAYGAGARWLLDRTPGLLGADDRVEGFVPRHPVVARVHREHPGLRLVATGTVADVLAAIIIAQRVTSREAGRSWTRLVRRLGSEAPGPTKLLLPPHPRVLARTSGATFHALGIERARASHLVEACARVPQLDAALRRPAADRQERWRSVVGIGTWTSALLSRIAAGDPDAVDVGDYHVKHLVSWNLAGEPRGSDERMCTLLAPYPGHRGRVVRLLAVAGQQPPRYGPRTAPSATITT